MTGSGNWTYLLPGRLAGADRRRHRPGRSPRRAVRAGARRAGGRAGHACPPRPRVGRAGDCRPGAAGRGSRSSPGPSATPIVGVSWTALADGEQVDTGSGPLEVVHTPGHSPDHVVFWHAASRTAFVGDLLVQGSTVVIPASHGGSLTAYLASLERLAALAPVRALPGHGPVIDDPLALIAHYLAHRRLREQQIRRGAVGRRLVACRHRQPHLRRTRPGAAPAGARQRPGASASSSRTTAS